MLDLTAVEVDDPTILQAQSHIEIACGRMFEDSERMGTRDLAWLRKAVAYQAAWLPSQPDWAQRLEITADGSASSATQYAPQALRLSGNARWALTRVSWLRSRGLAVPLANDSVDVEDPEDDEPGWSEWKPVEV
ncbi:hypothetical protein ABZ215_25195 [Amycolatopsis sp. NPDC006131]|uniref:hypothetical protein n=1 Tax=Amycolatopsis sp. NPDC006131 TaxID=3156731 RepID=UPI00339FD0C4